MAPLNVRRDEDKGKYTLFGFFSPFILGVLLFSMMEVFDMKSQSHLITLMSITIMGIAFSSCMIRTGQMR